MPIECYNDKKGKHQGHEARFHAYRPTGHPDAFGDMECTGLGSTPEEALTNLTAYMQVICGEALKEMETPMAHSVVFEALQKDKWFRPVSWRGSGSALMVSGQDIHVVPQGSRPQHWTPKLCDLTCQWEVVTPDTVLTEQDALTGTEEP